LRQRIYKHKSSEILSVRQKIKSKSETKVLESAVNESLKKKTKQKTARVFRTVYSILKKSRPYTYMAHGIEWRELNGLDSVRVLRSRESCADIAHHVGNEIRKAVVKNIVL
jgi:hypothetical protein